MKTLSALLVLLSGCALIPNYAPHHYTKPEKIGRALVFYFDDCGLNSQWTDDPEHFVPPTPVHRGIDLSRPTIFLADGRWLAQQEPCGEWSLVDPRTGNAVAWAKTLEEIKAIVRTK